MGFPAIIEISSRKNKDGFFVIRDMGTGNAMSITNDAENVVAQVVSLESYTPGQRILYYDTDGNIDELLIKDGKFVGFAPGPGR